ncbi:MAG: T9SS C-terminal target domain-containing protein [Saprospirales bacterium]|nr:MAG: T9SS C-terminal target domain-containing protein [Saprospirales bacterium]
MKKILPISQIVASLVLIFCNQLAFGSPQHYKHGLTSDIPVFQPFHTSEKLERNADLLTGVVKNGYLLQWDRREIEDIFERNEREIKLLLSLPGEREMVLEVEERHLFSGGHPNIFLASNPNEAVGDFKARFFKGKVEGSENSLVGVSVFEEELVAFIFVDGEHYSIARLRSKKDGAHIMYRESELLQSNTAQCFYDEEKHKVNEGHHGTHRLVDSSNCVTIYVEANYDIYVNKGSVNAAAAYVLGAFNQVSILYDMEDIDLTVSELLIWDEPSPYNGPGASQYLVQFRTYLNGNFNGDLAHLVGFGGGGGVAYLNVLCSSLWGVAYSGIAASYNDVPVYSWTVMVIAHEIGHNLGSPHTHACAWNGNNTAIDGCGPEAGYSEGCDGPLPSGGTVMSYCHLVGNVGIDLSLGFGPQPGDLMRNNVYSASCLDDCEPVTDDAGIIALASPDGLICETSIVPEITLFNFGVNQIDSVWIFYQIHQMPKDSFHWTGSLQPFSSKNVELPPVNANFGQNEVLAYTTLPNGQTDSNPENDTLGSQFYVGSNSLTLQIVLDQYPNETTWFLEKSGTPVLSGGPYGGYSNGDTVTYNFCTVSGCYLFTILDSFGDGICCLYGEGSYQLIDNNTGDTLAIGGEFGFIDTASFCLDAPFLAEIILGNDVECGQESNGSAIAQAIGGSGSYSFHWSNGSQDSIADQLSEGLYFLTATDGVDTIVDSVYIEDPNSIWYADNDGDGFGNPLDSIIACEQPTGYVDNNLDCDDTDPDVNPDAVEVCDGIDNNCDGNIDFGIPPAAVCQDASIYIDSSGVAHLHAWEIDGGSYDTCGIEMTMVSDSEFDCHQIGVHEVQLMVFDAADRSDTCTSEVTVIDNLAPVLVCKNATVQIETGDNPVQIDAQMFDDGSWDNCDSFSLDYNGPMEVDCLDAGSHDVELTATDASGNESTCAVQLHVWCADVSHQISGTIEVESGFELEGVDVGVSGFVDSTVQTNSDGVYSITLPTGFNYEIAPSLDAMNTNGLTTLNLILIQRHILGIQELGSPYKIIAADVNMDDQVSTIDLVILQSYILGSINELSHGISWRFLPADYVFSDPSSPFLDDWPEERLYDTLSQDQLEQDWIGIKIGDVNDGVSSSGIRTGDRDFVFEISTESYLNNEELKYSFYPETSGEIYGFQLEINWLEDWQEVQIDRTGSQLPDFHKEHIFKDREEGVVRINWWSDRALFVHSDVELFSLIVRKGENPDAAFPKLNQESRRLAPQVYVRNLEPRGIGLRERAESEARLKLYQNRPNPLADKTTIAFELPDPMHFEMEVFDNDGRVLFRRQGNGFEGLNYIRLDMSDFPAGIYHYRLSTDIGEKTRQMILVE